jgi:beta-glucanase (GH16 family)
VAVVRRLLAAAVIAAAALPAVATTSEATGAPTPKPALSCAGPHLTKPDGKPWVCAFDDEFDGTTLDRSQWAPQLTSNSNFTTGAAPYKVCYVDNAHTVSVSGGYLHLSVVRTPAPFTCAAPASLGLPLHNFSTGYEGGEVTTYYGFHQTYGRFAVRAKLPPAKVRGLQETLWLWPTDDTKYGGFPGSGEIDFAEFYSEYSDRVIPYLHYDYSQTAVSKTTNTNVVTNDYTCLLDTTRFHTYVVEWAPGRITLQYDGKTCLIDNYQASNVARPAPFDQPFFIALTQALGVGANRPTAATPFPDTTLIDYVRVWK